MTDEDVKDVELRIQYLFREGAYFGGKSVQEVMETDMRALIAEVKRLQQAYSKLVEALHAGVDFYSACSWVDKNTREQLLPEWRATLQELGEIKPVTR